MLFKKAGEYCDSIGITALLQEASCVIIGFSGGADSSVLLAFLARERERFPNLKIVCAHMNHMIRGDEADSDELFCRDVCTRLGIELFVCRKNIPAVAKERGIGLEEAAREERYSFFERLRQQLAPALIATAHNADDNLETVIFNLTRGSGIKGISGIAPIKDGVCIRPLLACTSDEIRTFATMQGIAFVTDSTNTDTNYTRNAIRHKVIPHLRELNPKVADAALRLSRSAREDCEYMDSEARKIINGAPLDLSTARALAPGLFARVLSLMYKEEAKSTADLSEKNISDCRKLLSSPEGGSISLPHGLAFFVDKDCVFVSKSPSSDTPSELARVRLGLFSGKELIFGDYCIYCCENGDYITDIKENIYNLSLHVCLDCDKINGNLFVRSRRPGDTVKLRDMSRKLKKLLCDADVPRRERDRLPVIEDSEGIVFVPFVGMRDGLQVGQDTKRKLHLLIYKRSMI